MIPYGRHDISEADIDAVIEVLRGEWLTTGPGVRQFESDLTQLVGGVPVIAVSSGTAALHVAYAAAGISPGDEIITPPLTFIATQAAAMHLGAIPVFVDVQEDTGNIDPHLVSSAISPRTKAIVAVDFAGHPADLDELRQIADHHGLLLIEDASHSLGSEYKGRPVGSVADITTFSFFPTKNITTGEGGALACKDQEIFERACLYARQGLIRNKDMFHIQDQGSWHQEVHDIGLNYRLSDIGCALGSSQLKRLAAFKERRRDLKERYDAAFGSLDSLLIPAQRDYVDPMWHLYPLRVPPTVRKPLFEYLRTNGVGVQVNYMPAHWHPVFGGAGRDDLSTTEEYFSREISLPIFPSLDNLLQTKIIETVLAGLEETWRGN